MKLNMNQDTTRKWVAVVAASKMPFDQFTAMTNADDWDTGAIDFKIVMNGYDVTDLDNMFDRLHNHHVNQEQRILDLEKQVEQLMYDLRGGK